MGLGKTFTGAEKLNRLNGRINLVVCQKSKIDDWLEHFAEHYFNDYIIYDLTDNKQMNEFLERNVIKVGIINYDLIFRRPELKKIHIDTLMLDESSLIQNETAKRSKFIMRLNFDNVILLSGTPTAGKYEKLWSQCRMLGWNISKKMYWEQFIDWEYLKGSDIPIKVIKGYKNVERLKRKLREYGAQFLKTNEVLDLPEQINQTITVPTIKEYRKFRKDSIVDIEDKTLVGDTTLTKMLCERQLCGQYNKDKLKAFRDLLESTNDRLIVFYNFNHEWELLSGIVNEFDDWSQSVVSGQIKQLDSYDKYDKSVTFIQYQAGAMGLNLQKANKIIYFTPPLSSELFEQSKKRIHRIGQQKTCFYYYMTCKNSIEEKIYKVLEMRKDFTDEVFREVF